MITEVAGWKVEWSWALAAGSGEDKVCGQNVVSECSLNHVVVPC